MSKIRDSLKRLLGRVYIFMKEKRIEIWFVLGAIFIPLGFALLSSVKPEKSWLLEIMIIFGFICLAMAMINIEIESTRERKNKQRDLEYEHFKFQLLIKKLDEIIERLKP
jgi:hypothetical protein